MKIIKTQTSKIVHTKIDNLCIFGITYPIRVQQKVEKVLKILKNYPYELF
jgi:hypothetical protein